MSEMELDLSETQILLHETLALTFVDKCPPAVEAAADPPADPAADAAKDAAGVLADDDEDDDDLD